MTTRTNMVYLYARTLYRLQKVIVRFAIFCFKLFTTFCPLDTSWNLKKVMPDVSRKTFYTADT